MFKKILSVVAAVIETGLVVVACLELNYRYLRWGYHPTPEHPACHGVSADSGDSARLQALADAGDAAAQYATGMRLRYAPPPVSDEKSSAVEYLVKAAAQGHAAAAFELGRIYDGPLRAAPDSRTKAMAYFRQAADDGDPDAMSMLSMLLKHLDGGPQQAAPTPAEQAEADIWSARVFAAHNGLVYRAGKNPLDAAQAQDIRAKAESGDKDAQFFYSVLLRAGLGGVATDDAAAYEWLEKAARQGHARAHSHLAIRAIRRNDTAGAIAAYTRGMELGDLESQVFLAHNVKAGDEDKAWALYQDAAARGEPGAQLTVARHYLSEDRDTRQDRITAYAWLTRAARNPAARMMSGIWMDCDAVADLLSAEDLAQGEKRSAALPAK